MRAAAMCLCSVGAQPEAAQSDERSRSRDDDRGTKEANEEIDGDERPETSHLPALI